MASAEKSGAAVQRIGARRRFVIANAATMARAVSASGRPLSVAGTMVTSPNGLGGWTRIVMLRADMANSGSAPTAFQPATFA